MPIVQCPNCSSRVEIDAKAAVYVTECRFCQRQFPVIGNDSLDLDLRTDQVQSRAYSCISKPAITLMWTTILALWLCMAGGVALILLGHDLYTHPKPQVTGWGKGQMFNDDKFFGFFQILFGAITALFGTLLHLFILIGSIKVKRLRGTGWGSTAAGLGIVSLFIWALPLALSQYLKDGFNCCLLFGALTFLGGTSAGIGIWMFVTMSKQEVKRALRWNAMGTPCHRGTPLEDDDAMR